MWRQFIGCHISPGNVLMSLWSVWDVKPELNQTNSCRGLSHHSYVAIHLPGPFWVFLWHSGDFLEGDVSSRERHSRCLKWRGTILMTKLPNRTSKIYKTCLTCYEAIQSGAGKLAKIFQRMSAIKSIWYFHLAKILQYSCRLADQNRFTETLFLTFFSSMFSCIHEVGK